MRPVRYLKKTTSYTGLYTGGTLGVYVSKSFHWMTDPTPDWFSKDYSYRMNPDTKEIELPTQSGNVIVSPGELITEAKGGFFVIGAIKPNRATRRHNAKTEER